eukprot:15358108-Ditylum_brightwellii.AAC.1
MKIQMPQRKLDQLGHIKVYCGVQSNKDSLERLKKQFQLLSSIAEINRQEIKMKESKNEEEKKELEEKVPEARSNLTKKGGVLKKLFKTEVHALLFLDHGVLMNANTSKTDMVKAL